MKLRHPWLIRIVAFLGALLVRGWIGTVRHRYQSLGPNVNPHNPDLTERCIYAFWHENMLLPAYQYGRPDVYVLISNHADGQLITEVCERLNLHTVRGSTTRGGVEAVRELMQRAGQDAHIVITPDGPRGPRREVKMGLVYLAARTGLPIVPTGIGYDHPWRLKSWDGFAIPRPWSRARTVTGELIRVPADATRDELEVYRQRVERAMHEVGRIADRWAEDDAWPNIEPRNVA